MFPKLKKHRVFFGGFTLIELIIAIGLITGTLVIFMDSVNLSLSTLDKSERKYIAVKLAQEGMELFISKRNNNVLCLENKTVPCTTVNRWHEDLVLGNGPTDFEISADEPSRLLSGNNLRSYSSSHRICYDAGNLGRFVQSSGSSCSAGRKVLGNPQRRIRVTKIVNGVDEALLVDSSVFWTERSGTARSLTLQKVLFNTQP